MSGAGATIVGLVLVLVLGAAAQTFRFPGDSSADVEGDSDYGDNGAADGEVPGELEMETEIDVRDAKHLRSIHIYPDDRVQILESGRSISIISFLCASSVMKMGGRHLSEAHSTFHLVVLSTQNELDESTKAQSSSSGMLRIPQCSLRPAHCQP